jgi:hypothetical protein
VGARRLIAGSMIAGRQRRRLYCGSAVGRCGRGQDRRIARSRAAAWISVTGTVPVVRVAPLAGPDSHGLANDALRCVRNGGLPVH